MIARLQNILNIRTGEGRPVLIFTGYYFLITATALTDCTLLKIDHTQFVAVMASQVAIMQSTVRTLSLRVRAANEQVAELNARL